MLVVVKCCVNNIASYLYVIKRFRMFYSFSAVQIKLLLLLFNNIMLLCSRLPNIIFLLTCIADFRHRALYLFASAFNLSVSRLVATSAACFSAFLSISILANTFFFSNFFFLFLFSAFLFSLRLNYFAI